MSVCVYDVFTIHTQHTTQQTNTALLPFSSYSYYYYSYGQDVFSITLSKIGIPDWTCQANRPNPARLAPMCTFRAVSLPFCMAGIVNTDKAQMTTNPAPTNKCGPGNNLPARP